jgi:hypothetical protein
VSAPAGDAVGADDRDLPPLWHVRAVGVAAAVLAAVLFVAWKWFL